MIGAAAGALAGLRAAVGAVRANWRVWLFLAGAVAVMIWRRALRRQGAREGRDAAQREGAAAAAEVSGEMRDANSAARDAGGGDVVERLRGNGEF
jgi:membrane protein implicated in regulation of membrane protease activity